MALSDLKGVGEKTALCLTKLGIESIPDLLLHLPIRYEDRTRVYPMDSAIPGQNITVEGTITKAFIQPGKRRSLVVYLEDATELMMVRFYYFYGSQLKQFKAGMRMRCFGEIRTYRHQKTMVHPEYRVFDADTVLPVDAHLTPIYSTTSGMSQKILRGLIQKALGYLEDEHLFTELLPVETTKAFAGLSLAEALQVIHQPTPDISLASLMEKAHPAQERVVFEELLAHQLCLKKMKQKQSVLEAIPMGGQGELISSFLDLLPFELTNDQKKVAKEIGDDLQKSTPMLRLLQGDVGSGKTVIAALAAFQAIASGFQVAIMAPTEILCDQHYAAFADWCEELGIHVAILNSKMKARDKRETLGWLKSGDIQLVVGTHALFQEAVSFHQLGLVIVDEQHRFGVEQRLTLTEKGSEDNLVPHQLIMTATPIPRTLAMSLYAELDVSTIKELPPGRKPIQTVVMVDAKRDELIQRIRSQPDPRPQVYWVCPLIEESEKIEGQAVQVVVDELRAKLPDHQVAVVHGKCRPEEKEALMAQFKNGEIDILVATTVIEVGVNVPNASIMVIENAERMGLAQLHQLRGRVGRGETQSHCVLLYHSPISEQSMARLEVMRSTNDGFVVAEKDLALRGQGEWFGKRQSGVVQMKVADVFRDQKWLKRVRTCAKEIWAHDQDRAESIIRRWLPKAQMYGRVG